MSLTIDLQSFPTPDYFMPVCLADLNSSPSMRDTDLYRHNDGQNSPLKPDFSSAADIIQDEDANQFIDRNHLVRVQAARTLLPEQEAQLLVDPLRLQIAEYCIFAARYHVKTIEQALEYYRKGLETRTTTFTSEISSLLEQGLKYTAMDLIRLTNTSVNVEIQSAYQSTATRGWVRCLAGEAEMLYRLGRYAESSQCWSVLALTQSELYLEPIARVAECVIALGRCDVASEILRQYTDVVGIHSPSISQLYLRTFLDAAGSVAASDVIQPGCHVNQVAAFDLNSYLPSYFFGHTQLSSALIPVVPSESSQAAAAFIAARHFSFWGKCEPDEEGWDPNKSENLPLSSVVENSDETLYTSSVNCETMQIPHHGSPLFLLKLWFLGYVPTALSRNSINGVQLPIPIIMQMVKALGFFTSGSFSNLLLAMHIPDGWTPLHFAAIHNNINIVTTLFSLLRHICHSKDALRRYLYLFLNCRLPLEYGHLTALHLASMFGNTTIVGLLLREGASPWVPGPEGRLPLHVAAAHGEAGCVRLLLDACASDAERYAMANYCAPITPIQEAIMSGAFFCMKTDGASPCLRCQYSRQHALLYSYPIMPDGVNPPTSYENLPEPDDTANTFRYYLPSVPLNPPTTHSPSVNFYFTVLALLQAGAEPICNNDQVNGNSLIMAAKSLNSDAVLALLTWASSTLTFGSDDGRKELAAWVNSKDENGMTAVAIVTDTFVGAAADRRHVSRISGPLYPQPQSSAQQQTQQQSQKTRVSDPQPRTEASQPLFESLFGLGPLSADQLDSELAQILFQKLRDNSADKQLREILAYVACNGIGLSSDGQLPSINQLARDLAITANHYLEQSHLQNAHNISIIPLHEAVRVVRHLVAHGARPDIGSPKGESAREIMQRFVRTENILTADSDGTVTGHPLFTEADLQLFMSQRPPDVDPVVWQQRQHIRILHECNLVETTCDLWRALFLTTVSQRDYLSAESQQIRCWQNALREEIPTTDTDTQSDDSGDTEQYCLYCHNRDPGFICSGCRVARYCSQRCQQADWQRHRLVCGKQSITG